MCLQNIIEISAKLRAVGPVQRLITHFGSYYLRRLQTNQTHIGSTLHVGPNYQLVLNQVKTIYIEQVDAVCNQHPGP